MAEPERFSLHLLNNETLGSVPLDVQLALAKRAKILLNEDFRRVSDSKELALAIANPDDPRQTQELLDSFYSPKVPGTHFGGIFVDDKEGQLHPENMQGFFEVSPWLHGNAKPFGRLEQVKALLASHRQNPERRPQVLSAFSVQTGLVRSALTAISLDSYILPQMAALHVPVHVNDAELQTALDDLGASRRSIGTINVEGYKGTYQHRILPPRKRRL